MHFDPPLIGGTLIKRYKRFLADVRLDSGELITVHCPNTGAMTACAEPGFRTWLSISDNPKRKYAHTWQLAENFEQAFIGINSAGANKLLAEALASQSVPELAQYSTIRQEVKYGDQNSRIDFLLQKSGLPDCYVEVKSVTLCQGNLGRFPDAVSARGQKHLQELIKVKQQGETSMLFFVAQHTGIKQVTVAEDIDVKYAKLLKEAINAGVEVVAYSCDINEKKIELNQRIPFVL